MGYYKFESIPPFKIVHIDSEPILHGNEKGYEEDGYEKDGQEEVIWLALNQSQPLSLKQLLN